VCGVLTDIDDTLTHHNAIEPAAARALQALQGAGVPLVAVTGRPLGWCEPLVRSGALPAVVAESGAVLLFREAGALRVEYAYDEATRRADAQRAQPVVQRILREVPGATVSPDCAGRATGIAIDHAEFVTLDGAAIAQVAALMRAAGMQATVSSIHINGWYGEHTKFTGARWALQRLFDCELQAELDRWVFVGDSTNDQAMFARLPFSVGVANLMRFAAELASWPAYITRAERGAGFAEVADALLAARGG
jgi:hypothetical protein